jgi:hypothetical protein
VTKSLQVVTVEEAFDITGRGVAIAFRGSTANLPVGVAIPARVLHRDGTSTEASAFVELILRRDPTPHELAALLLNGLSKKDVTPGCTVELYERK